MISATYVLAVEKQNLKAAVQSDFILNDSKDIVFITYEDLKVNEDLKIPKGAVVYGENMQAQRPLRWHKSGFILCKVLKYSPDEFTADTIDVSDKDIYLAIRKYEKVYKKDVAIVTSEILVTQGASFFAPGVDILYFFTKGAIQREKNPHWFKAGVFNAYENSICWFWLKGKTINLKAGEDVKIQTLEKVKAYKLKTKMVKRKTREDIKALKKNLKKEFKLVKKQEKEEMKKLKKELKEEEKLVKEKQNNAIGEDFEIEVKDVHAAVKIEEDD